MSNKIFVNLPVKNLDKSVEFFTNLGFKFNPKFTNKNATCMIVSEDIFVMLLVDKFFKTFSHKKISDTTKNFESIVALSTESREKVDEMIEKVLENGGIESRKAQDQGWMYSRSFQDIDGHLWEIMHMDETKIEKTNEK